MPLPKEIRETARQMRRDGLAIGAIADELKIAKSTVSLWVRDIVLTDDQVAELKAHHVRYAAQNKGAQVNRAKFLALRDQYQTLGRLRARENPTPLHLMGCMLYWAEGAKHRTNMYFANSDVDMQRIWIRFLTDEMGVTFEEIAVHILLHTQEPEAVHISEEFWLTALNIPRSCLRKTVYKKPGAIRKNKLPHGICGLRVSRVDLLQQIFGSIQEYAGIARQEWLF